MDSTGSLLVSGVWFLRNTIGVIIKPYATYRRIVDHGRLGELFYIGILLAGYFALASLVKEASFRPFLLTRQFVALTTTAAVSFFLASTTIWMVGTLVGGTGSWQRITLAWGYTMMPTVMWFLVTSLLYVLLPPPRTTGMLGVAFSIVYLIFSVTLFFWKIVLSYLTLRFGLRLDAKKIAVAAAIMVPLFVVYSIAMYRLGVFRVPFL